MTVQATSSPQRATGTTGPVLSNAVVGPLTIRDLGVLGSVLIIFVASVVPIIQTLAGSLNLWNTGGLFYLAIGVILPLIVGALFLARRMSPKTQLRIGSLSTDQFASVVASFATFFFFTGTVTSFGIAYLVGLIGSLLLLAFTACAQWIPALASDFVGRPEVPAHLVARDAVPAVKRPSAPKPVVEKAGSKVTATPKTFEKGASFGAAVSPVPAPEDSADDKDTSDVAVDAPAAWGTSQSSLGHLAAGQIFTPAKETSPAAQTAHAVAGAEVSSPINPTQTFQIADVAAEIAKQDAAAAAEENAPEVEEPAATPPASEEAEQPAEESPAVELAEDENATSMNPQVTPAAEQDVAEPAKESIGATVDPQVATTVSTEPFWFAVDRPQNVIDEGTRQFVFKLNPGAWILALEDRGSSFLVQDSQGKTGVLLDLVGIERASDSQ